MASRPSGLDVARYLHRQDDSTFITQCNNVVGHATQLVKGYTRGRGFEDDESIPDDLRSVVILVAARMATNPNMLKGETQESYAYVGGGADGGFTEAEQAVLHRYRRRVA